MTLREEIDAVLQRYVAAYVAGDAAGCAAGYAPDGQVYSPYGPPAIGRDAIRDLHEEWISEGEENKRMAIIDMGGGAEAPWCLASYRGDIPDPAGGAPDVEGGVALHAFRRDPAEGLQIIVSSLTALDATDDEERTPT